MDYNHGTGHGVGAYLAVHEGPVGVGRDNSVLQVNEVGPSELVPETHLLFTSDPNPVEPLKTGEHVLL